MIPTVYTLTKVYKDNNTISPKKHISAGKAYQNVGGDPHRRLSNKWFCEINVPNNVNKEEDEKNNTNTVITPTIPRLKLQNISRNNDNICNTYSHPFRFKIKKKKYKNKNNNKNEHAMSHRTNPPNNLNFKKCKP
eukprot:122814_1